MVHVHKTKMRVLRIPSLVALAIASRAVGAQLVVNSLPPARFGLTAGVNVTTFAGDGLGPTDNRTGFIGGGVLVTPFTPVFSTQLELLYAMKGMKSLSPSNAANYALLNGTKHFYLNCQRKFSDFIQE